MYSATSVRTNKINALNVTLNCLDVFMKHNVFVSQAITMMGPIYNVKV
jgi:hypothetical protein